MSETVFRHPCPRYSCSSVPISQEWVGPLCAETVLVLLGCNCSSLVSFGVEGERRIQGGAKEGEEDNKDEVAGDIGDNGDDDEVDGNAMVEEVGVDGDNGDKGDDEDGDDDSAKEDSEDRDGQEAFLSLSLSLPSSSFWSWSWIWLLLFLVARRFGIFRCDPGWLLWLPILAKARLLLPLLSSMLTMLLVPLVPCSVSGPPAGMMGTSFWVP